MFNNSFALKHMALCLIISASCFAQNNASIFREIRFSLSPGLAYNPGSSYATDDPNLEAGANVSYFLTPYLAFAVPYSYSKQKGNKINRVGVGPRLSIKLFQDNVHIDTQAAFQYHRIFKQNEFGINIEGHIGFMINKKNQFSLGPYYAYHQSFISGNDYKSNTIGLTFNFRNFSDAHLQ